ncbi:DUF302 domain-containing protein [Nitrospira sp. Kam-Ns4a]
MWRGQRLQSSVALIIAVLLTTGCAGMMTKMMEMKYPDRRFVVSAYPFDETVSRVKRAIEAKQMMVVFTADHQAMLSMVGVNAKGMLGIEFFHPRYGKVIMQNDHAAGIEIPLRLVVMETPDGKAMLSYYKPSIIFANYKGLGGMARELDGVYDAIVAAVSS